MCSTMKLALVRSQSVGNVGQLATSLAMIDLEYGELWYSLVSERTSQVMPTNGSNTGERREEGENQILLHRREPRVCSCI